MMMTAKGKVPSVLGRWQTMKQRDSGLKTRALETRCTKLDSHDLISVGAFHLL